MGKLGWSMWGRRRRGGKRWDIEGKKELGRGREDPGEERENGRKRQGQSWPESSTLSNHRS